MLVIQTTPYSFRFKCGPRGHITTNNFYLGNYLNKFNDWEFNYRSKKWFVARKYVYYNHKHAMLYVPRYDLDNFCQMLRDANIHYLIEELPLCQGKDVVIPLIDGLTPKSDIQAGGIEYVSYGEGHMRGVAIQPGAGKTVTLIVSLANLGKRAIITSGSQPGPEQWVEEIARFTKLDMKNDVFLLQGNASIAKLLSQIDKSLFPKIVVASIATIRSYCSDSELYENYPFFDEFCDRCNIGVHGIDETHLNFHANLMVDLRWNPNLVVPLTATFGRSNQTIDAIFNQVYPPSIRYGEGQFERYTDVVSYSYSLITPRQAWWTNRGYNHNNYEKWLLNKKRQYLLERLYNQVYKSIFDQKYINIKHDGQKCLILCCMEDMCDWLKRRFRKDYPELRINKYVSATDRSALVDSDVIISTPGSAGTGTDIKNLRTMIQTISVKSDVTNKQNLGRLRKLPDDLGPPVFAYCYNKLIAPHNDHADGRRAIFRHVGKTFTEHYIY